MEDNINKPIIQKIRKKKDITKSNPVSKPKEPLTKEQIMNNVEKITKAKSIKKMMDAIEKVDSDES